MSCCRLTIVLLFILALPVDAARAQHTFHADAGGGISFPTGPGDAGEYYKIGYNVRGATDILFRDHLYITAQVSFSRFPLDQGWVRDQVQGENVQLDPIEPHSTIFSFLVGAKRLVDMGERMYAYAMAAGGVFNVEAARVAIQSDVEGEQNSFEFSTPPGFMPGAAFGGGVGIDVVPPVRVYLHSSLNIAVSNDPLTFWPVGAAIAIGV